MADNHLQEERMVEPHPQEEGTEEVAVDTVVEDTVDLHLLAAAAMVDLEDSTLLPRRSCLQVLILSESTCSELEYEETDDRAGSGAGSLQLIPVSSQSRKPMLVLCSIWICDPRCTDKSASSLSQST